MKKKPAMKKMNEEEITKFLEEKLKESGYPFENKVGLKLQSSFTVDREVPYTDKDESKQRTIDFVASAFIPDGDMPPEGKKKAVASLKLVIECKSLPDHAWIFFPGKDRQVTFTDMVSAIKSVGKDDPLYKIVPLLTFPGLFHAASYKEIILDDQSQERNRSNKRFDNLYGAVHAVTKATRDQIENMQKTLKHVYLQFNDLQLVPVVTLYQPLIVFSGRMYVCQIVNDEINLIPLKYAQIPKNYTSGIYNEDRGYVHIVNFTGLDDYLQILHNYYWSGSKFILKNQDLLLDLTRDNAVSWKNFG